MMENKDKKDTEVLKVETSSFSLQTEKERRMIELELKAKIQEDIKNSKLSTDELKTTLTEDEIATTTQIDVKGTEEIKNFIESTLPVDAKKTKKKWWKKR